MERPDFPPPGLWRRLGPELRRRFGQRVHKVTLRAGFGCPNRDGTVGRGGCVFCCEAALYPASGPVFGPIEEQLAAGLQAARRLTGAEKAVAYFQNGSATYTDPGSLRRLCLQAIDHPHIVGLAVGTRPDCLPERVVEVLAEVGRHKPLWVEIGLQTARNRTLALLNRNHSAHDFELAVERCHRAGLEVVAHVILDLPGEGLDDVRRTASLLNRLRVEGVKIHNLHVLRGTVLADWYEKGRLQLRSLEQYARLAADFLELLDPAMVIHRLTGEGPARLMLAPEWGRDKQRILQSIERQLRQRGGYQGRHHVQAR